MYKENVEIEIQIWCSISKVKFFSPQKIMSLLILEIFVQNNILLQKDVIFSVKMVSSSKCTTARTTTKGQFGVNLSWQNAVSKIKKKILHIQTLQNINVIFQSAVIK